MPKLTRETPRFGGVRRAAEAGSAGERHVLFADGALFDFRGEKANEFFDAFLKNLFRRAGAGGHQQGHFGGEAGRLPDFAALKGKFQLAAFLFHARFAAPSEFTQFLGQNIAAYARKLVRFDFS